MKRKNKNNTVPTQDDLNRALKILLVSVRGRELARKIAEDLFTNFFQEDATVKIDRLAIEVDGKVLGGLCQSAVEDRVYSIILEDSFPGGGK